MSLKRILDTLEGIDDTTAKLYTKGDDGKFRLDLEGEEEGEGYKSALQKERKAREEAEKALKARERSEAEEKARKEREDMERKGEYEKLSAADKAALKAAEEKAAALESRIRNGAVERAAMEAIQAAKGIPKALLPHILPNLETTPDGDGYKVIVKGDPAKKLTDYVSSLKAEMAWGFEGTGASGGGANPSGGTPLTGIHARHDELSKKATLTSSESIELVKLAGQIESEPKPKP